MDDDTLPAGFELEDPGSSAIPAGFELEATPAAATGSAPALLGRAQAPLPLALEDTPANDPAAPPPAAPSQAPTPQAPMPWASQPLGPAGGQPAGAGVTVRPERGTDTGAFLPDRSPGQGAAGAQANAAAQGLFGGIAGAVSGIGTAIGAGVNSLNRSSMIQMGEPPDAPNTVGMGLAAASQRAGDRLNAETQVEFPVNTRNEGFGTNLARGAGGLAPIVAAGMLPGGAALIPGIIGAQSFDSTYRDAKAHGATDETAFQTGVVNGAVQAGIMSVPLSGALLKVADPLMRDGLIKTALNFAGHGVGFETAAEAGRFVDNVIARQTYDPDRKLMEGVDDQVGENVALSLLVPFAHGLPSLARSVMVPKIDASPELRQGVAGLTEAAQDHQAAVGGDAQTAAPPLEPPAAPLAQDQASPESTAPAVASPEPAQAPLESTPAPASADAPPQTEVADSLPPGFELETPAPPAAPEPAPKTDDLPPGFELEQPAPAATAATAKPGSSIDGFMQAMKRGESGGRNDARNPGSSASGYYQFLDGTFEQFLHSPANTGGWTMADKANPAAEDAAMRWNTAGNAATLRARLGRDPTGGELAAAHLLGAHGALALIEHPGGSAESALAGVMGPDAARNAVAKNGRLLRGDAGQALGSIAGYYLGKDAGTPVPTMAGKSVGAPMSVFANGGARIDVQPMLVDLADLTASHDGDGRPNPDYPHAEGLQPRDRSSAASQSQVRSLAANLQPERLAPSSDAGSGAPIVNASGVVESGNGRTMALRQVYTDPQLGPQRDAYRSWLEGQGLDLTGMQQPALVSQRLTPLDAGQRAAFARDANERSTLGMNPAEQARADAARVGRSIDLWQGNSAGAASNADFVRDVMAQMSPEERGAMMLPDGTLSAGGERRIQGAVTAHAYGDAMGPTLERFLNGDDAGTKAVAGALADAAGPWAQMRGAAARGEIPPELDITGDLAGAVQTLARARQLGRPVAELAAQTDLDRPPLSAPAQALLGAMFRDPKMKQAAGRDRVASTLQDYATEAMRQTAGQDLFGAPPPTAMAVLEATRRAPDGGASKARLLSMRDAARSAHMVAENADARSIAPDVRVARERLATAATALMRYMGLPPEVGLNLVERIVDAATGKASDGSYQRRLIEFALDTRPGQVPFKLFHEIVHGLMDPDLGLVSDGQRRVLEAAAERWLSLGDNRRALAQLYGLDPASPADARVLREEAISQMGEDALARGITQSGSVGWTVRRMKNLVGGFGNLLRGRGFRTADDVFRGMLQGRRALPGAAEALAAVGPGNRGMAMLAQAGLPPSLLAQEDEGGQPGGAVPVEEGRRPTSIAEARGDDDPLRRTGQAGQDVAGQPPRSKLSQRIADLAAVPDKYMSLRPEPSAHEVMSAPSDDSKYWIRTGDGRFLKGPDGTPTLGSLTLSDGVTRPIGIRRQDLKHTDLVLKHFEARSTGYRDNLDLVRDVVANYQEVRRLSPDRLLLAIRADPNRAAYVELVSSGRMWRVVTGGLRVDEQIDREPLVPWQKPTNASEAAAGPQPPLLPASAKASATGTVSPDQGSTDVAPPEDGDKKVLRSGLRTDPANAADGVPVTRSGQSDPDVAPPAEPDKKFSLRQTDTPEFKRWFGDSKVVDSRGKPLVVFHGTPDARALLDNGSFTTVVERMGQADANRAFFFTASRPKAKSYADPMRAWDFQSAEPAVLQTYLSLQNPKVLDWGGKSWNGTRQAVADAMAAGHDGVIIHNVIDYYNKDAKRQKPSDVFVAFRPEQIKSATDNNGSFDPADPRIAFSLRDAPDAVRFAQKAAGVPGFYSAVARTAALLKQEKGSGPQFAAALRNAAGVKPEELRWLGVEDWLRNQPSVTKSQVMDFIAANNLGIRELARGDGLPNAALDASDAAEDKVRSVLAEIMGRPTNDPAVGRRFNELLMGEEPEPARGLAAVGQRLGDLFGRPRRSIESDPELTNALNAYSVAQEYLDHLDRVGGGGSTKFEDYQLPGGDNYREVLLTLPERAVPEIAPLESQPFVFNPHEAELVPYREGSQTPFYGDQTPEEYAAGEEQRQRDQHTERAEWRNEARRLQAVEQANFQSAHWAEKNVVAHLRLNDRIAPDGKRVLFVEEVQSDWHQAGRERSYVGDSTASNESVPDAPFRTSWPALAMKRVLRMAAEDGYDRVAWTTGDTQAKRYDLPGDGMRGFYDKMLPNEVGKIVRPLGSGVSRGVVDIVDGERPDLPPSARELPVHQVEMTPQLRAAALEDGFPLYSLRDSGMRLIHSADERRRGFNDAVRRTLVPITAGAKEAQVAAGRFANAIADVSWRYGQVDRLLVKRFNPAERRAMWDALDEQSLFEIELAEQMAQVPETDRSKMEAAERAAFKGFGMERLPSEQREIVEQLNDLAQQTWYRMKGRKLVNPNADGLPYWAPRFFVKPNLANGGGETALVREAQQGGSTRAIDPLGMNLKTAKPLDRELRYTEDSIKAMKAKYGDATELVRDIRVVGAALSAEERSIAGVDLVNSIKDYTVAAGAPAITAQPPSWQDADYVEINHPSLKEWVPMMRQLDDGSSEPVKDILGNQVMTRRLMRVHKDYEHPLRAVLTTPQGDFYKAAIKLKGLATAAIMFSPFMHLGVELGRALPALPGTVLSMRWLRDGGRLRADSAFMSDAMRNGLRMVGGSWMQDITGIYDAPNIKPGHGWLAKAMGTMGDLVNAKFGDEIRNAIDRGGERAGEFWHQTMLWDRVADLQVAIYRDMRSRYVAAGFDDKTASIMAAHLANRYAGAMPKEALSTAANKAANLAMFSRSFTLGNLGVMKDMLNGMPGYVRVQIEAHAGDDTAKLAAKTLRRKALSAFVMDIGLFYLSNSLAQNAMQLVSGQTLDEVAAGYVRRAVAEGQKVAHSPWELFNPFGVTESLLPTADNEPGKQDRIWMGNQADGTAIYARLPTGKIGEEFTGWLLSPATMLRNKTSTLVRPTWEAITGRDSLGKPIYDPDVEGIGGLLHNAGRAVMHIVAAQAPFGAIEAAGTIARRTVGAITGGNTPLQGKDLSDAAMQLLPSFLPPPLTAQISHGYPGGPEAGLEAAAQRAQQFTRSQVMPEAKRLLQGDDEDGARALLSGAGLDDRAIAGIIRSTNNPGRGQVRMQQQFQRSATPAQQSRLQNITGGSSGLATAADSLGDASTPDASRMGLGYASPAVPSNAMNQAAQAGIVQAQQMARSAGR